MAQRADHDQPTRTRGREFFQLAMVVAAWTVVAGVHLFGVRIANLWLLAPVVYGLVWLLAMVATTTFVVIAWRRRRRRRAAAAGAVAIAALAGGGVVAVDWTYAYAHGQFRLHREDFAAIAALADAGGLDSDEYYGALLPDDLRHLSVTGRAAWIGPRGEDRSALFLPTWTGIPDGGVGYLYRTAAPAHDIGFDCFADPCQVRWTLGDGWQWVG
ncbi:hypothetical protein EDC02_5861 [Micromonospora sp. Llam0]|uniref:hypothetical protein n=1 Tax=Micromonospora sp. Llam0 TaxID=2485143 RepID=UPI000FB32E7D|nr:hypothetical protein [Micromonospora sp. Llam0]ROO50998.1 hypothetical protein EDC02_5861 [Micromonospora sp. Llam0]